MGCSPSPRCEAGPQVSIEQARQRLHRLFHSVRRRGAISAEALLEEKSEQQRTGTIALKRNFPLERGSSHGDRLVCDYSLNIITSRPAKVGDNLVTTVFFGTYTRGFAAVGDLR
jgi:hypothetical protein